jgi:hypothetical protein
MLKDVYAGLVLAAIDDSTHALHSQIVAALAKYLPAR